MKKLYEQAAQLVTEAQIIADNLADYNLELCKQKIPLSAIQHDIATLTRELAGLYKGIGEEIKMRYFKLDEFNCPCCGKNEIEMSFALRLDKAREYANTPFIISSGYRCSKHNKEAGGSETSSHLKGLAVDIIVKDSKCRYKILTGLIQASFYRIGVHKDFIHVDFDTNKTPNVIWIY